MSRTHNSFASPLFTPATSASAPSVPSAPHSHSAVPVVAPPPAVASLHPSSNHSVANPFSAESLFQSSKGKYGHIYRTFTPFDCYLIEHRIFLRRWSGHITSWIGFKIFGLARTFVGHGWCWSSTILAHRNASSPAPTYARSSAYRFFVTTSLSCRALSSSRVSLYLRNSRVESLVNLS